MQTKREENETRKYRRYLVERNKDLRAIDNVSEYTTDPRNRTNKIASEIFYSDNKEEVRSLEGELARLQIRKNEIEEKLAGEYFLIRRFG